MGESFLSYKERKRRRRMWTLSGLNLGLRNVTITDVRPSGNCCPHHEDHNTVVVGDAEYCIVVLAIQIARLRLNNMNPLLWSENIYQILEGVANGNQLRKDH